MASKHVAIRIATAVSLTIAILALLATNSFSANKRVTQLVLVDDATYGYYNNALGTILDGTQLQFPPANVSGGDPIIVPAPEPDLTPAASVLGIWLAPDPFPLNANWSGLQDIPFSWAINTETAIIYPIDTGTQGITRLVGNFGVDNGIFVWVNGEYRFGAIEPGPVVGYEYTGVDLGSLPRGQNYIQILLEDHGSRTGFTVSIAGIVDTVSGHITSPSENITIGPSTLIFSADAWASDGASVEEVQFFVFYDGVWHPAGIDSTVPYEVVWQTPNTLRSQQLEFGVHIIDDLGKAVEFADVVHGVNYLESLGNPDVDENWIPTRAYLNQRSLVPDGDVKCSAASMSMVLAMNSIISWDYLTLSTKANEMYPRVLNGNGDAYVGGMVSELEQQGMDAETRAYSADDAWSTIKQEIDAERPAIVRTAHGVVTAAGHFFVAVGYREAVGSRQVIAYDPFGRWLGICCTNNYDLNTIDPSSRKGQWVSYDFDLAFGSYNWLITGWPATGESSLRSTTATPTTRPDLVSGEPENIGTYPGVNIEAGHKTCLPLVITQ